MCIMHNVFVAGA